MNERALSHHSVVNPDLPLQTSVRPRAPRTPYFEEKYISRPGPTREAKALDLVVIKARTVLLLSNLYSTRREGRRGLPQPLGTDQLWEDSQRPGVASPRNRKAEHRLAWVADHLVIEEPKLGD